MNGHDCIRALAQVADVMTAILFTTVPMMPFKNDDESNHFGFAPSSGWSLVGFIYLCLASFGGLAQEVTIFANAMMNVSQVRKEGTHLIHAFLDYLWHANRAKRYQLQALASSANLFEVSQAVAAYNEAQKGFFISLRIMFHVAFDGIMEPRRWSKYLSTHGYEFAVRVVCVATLIWASAYGEEHYNDRYDQKVHSETVLGFVVLLLWVRTFKVLVILETMGSFYYMLGRLVYDVAKWMAVFCIGILAFASCFFVIYRNQHMESGYLLLSRDPVWLDMDLDSSCQRLDTLTASIGGCIEFLLEVTLDGAGYWNCFASSNLYYVGLTMYGLYLLFVIIILVRLLKSNRPSAQAIYDAQA